MIYTVPSDFFFTTIFEMPPVNLEVSIVLVFMLKMALLLQISSASSICKEIYAFRLLKKNIHTEIRLKTVRIKIGITTDASTIWLPLLLLIIILSIKCLEGVIYKCSNLSSEYQCYSDTDSDKQSHLHKFHSFTAS